MSTDKLSNPQPGRQTAQSLADLRPAEARPADPLQPAKEAYYGAARMWDAERLRTIEVSRNRAWLVAALCVACMVAMAFAIVKLALEHHVDVVTVAFDGNTNKVRTVQYSDQREQMTANEGFIRNQLYEFVLNAETVDPADGERRRGLIRLTTEPGPLQNQLLADMVKAEQPEGGALGKVRRPVTTVSVQSISMLNPQTAHVQFSTEVLQDNRGAFKREWAVVIGFRFADSPRTIEEAMANPFGFQVTSYHKSATTN